MMKLDAIEVSTNDIGQAISGGRFGHEIAESEVCHVFVDLLGHQVNVEEKLERWSSVN